MRPVAVLFVDDDPNVLTAVGRLLRLESYPAYFATSAEDGLALAKKRDVGVVVSDFKLPGMSGIELLARLRRERPDVQRVLLTAHSDASVLAAAVNSGEIFRYVPKPWDNRDLLRVVREAVAQAEVLRENRRLRVLARRRNRQLDSLARSLERQVEERTRGLAEASARLREAALGVVRVLATAAEQGSAARAGHAEAAARHAVAIGRRLGLSARELDDVRMGAMLHDVGLVGAAAGEGAAASGADDGHADRGARLLEPLPFSRAVVAAVRHHHERWDGRGTPCGLRGTEIPLVARIVAVADALASMTAGTEGFRAMAPEDAQAELIRGAGRVHDPECVSALVAALEDEAARTERGAVAAGSRA